MQNQSSQFLKTYNTFSNPQCQKSDNGPSFNSKETLNFTSKCDIKHVKTPLGHPSANIVEMVMKPIGKAMEIRYLQNKNEAETLNMFLETTETLLIYPQVSLQLI